jgi:hypothetical protein
MHSLSLLVSYDYDWVGDFSDASKACTPCGVDQALVENH